MTRMIRVPSGVKVVVVVVVVVVVAPLRHSDTALLPDLQGAAKGHPCRKGTHATQSYRQLAQSTDLKQTRIHDSQTSVFVVIKCCSEAMLSADTAYQLSVLLRRNTWKNTYTLP